MALIVSVGEERYGGMALALVSGHCDVSAVSQRDDKNNGLMSKMSIESHEENGKNADRRW